MDSVSTYFLKINKAVITKLYQNIKQIELYTNCEIWGQKGRDLRRPTSHNLRLNFETPSISVVTEDTNLKFGFQLAHHRVLCKKCKIWSNGAWRTFLHFGTPFVSQEHLKLQTSNLVSRLSTKMPSQKSKLCQMGRDLGHLTYVYNFSTSSVSLGER